MAPSRTSIQTRRMHRRPGRRARVASSCATVVISAIALASSAPSAAASTWNHQWDYLHFPPRVGDGSPGPSRTITLNGTYRWRSFSAHWAHQDQPTARSRTLRLVGRYSWRDTLYISPPRRTYLHVSELVNTRTGGRVTIEYTETGGYGDGQYHWGSTLDNVRG